VSAKSNGLRVPERYSQGVDADSGSVLRKTMRRVVKNSCHDPDWGVGRPDAERGETPKNDPGAPTAVRPSMGAPRKESGMKAGSPREERYISPTILTGNSIKKWKPTQAEFQNGESPLSVKPRCKTPTDGGRPPTLPPHARPAISNHDET